MKLSRLISGRNYRGELDYLPTQRKYEIARTVILFAVSISLFIAGFITTGKRENLLTIVAILGCLPACKSLISVIMFIKAGRSDSSVIESIKDVDTDGLCLYDCYFTSYDKNYKLQHLSVKNSTVIGLCIDKDFDENEFKKHLCDVLKKNNIKDVSIKIFTSTDKYIARLKDLSSSATIVNDNDTMIISTILDIIL